MNKDGKISGEEQRAAVKTINQVQRDKNTEKSNQDTKDAFATTAHTAVDVAGMLPVVGDVIDLGHAGYWATKAAMTNDPEEKAQLNKTAAITAMAGLIPLGLGQVGKQVAKIAPETAAKVGKALSGPGAVEGGVLGAVAGMGANLAAGGGLATSLATGIGGSLVGRVAGKKAVEAMPALLDPLSKIVGKGVDSVGKALTPTPTVVVKPESQMSSTPKKAGLSPWGRFLANVAIAANLGMGGVAPGGNAASFAANVPGTAIAMKDVAFDMASVTPAGAAIRASTTPKAPATPPTPPVTAAVFCFSASFLVISPFCNASSAA